MRMTSSFEGDIAIITLEGKMSWGATTEVREKIGELLAEGVSKILLDMGSVRSIDSSGLAVIVTSLLKAKKVGGELILAKPNDLIITVLKGSNLTTIMNTFESLEAAMQYFTDA